MISVHSRPHRGGMRRSRHRSAHACRNEGRFSTRDPAAAQFGKGWSPTATRQFFLGRTQATIFCADPSAFGHIEYRSAKLGSR